MLGLFIYLVAIMLPVLIPAGVSVAHAVGEKRASWTARTARTASKSVPMMARPIPAAAPA